MCLGNCPSGYTENATGKVCTLVDDNSLSIRLENKIQLNEIDGVIVGSDGTNTYPNWEATGSHEPVPSIYRGYLFRNTAYMTKTPFVFSSFYSVSVWVKPLQEGYLFVKKDGSTIKFSISFSNSGDIIREVLLNDGTTLTFTSSFNLFNAWHLLVFEGDIVTGDTIAKYYKDGVQQLAQTSATKSPFWDKGNLIIGRESSTNGFKGFL